jgi:hypothetical protein
MWTPSCTESLPEIADRAADGALPAAPNQFEAAAGC